MSKNEKIMPQTSETRTASVEGKAAEGGTLEQYFSESSKPAMSSKPNGGMNSAAVDSLILGLKTETTEDELLNELEQAKTGTPAGVNIIYDFRDVPENRVYSEAAKYKLFKRTSKREFYINGRMLESRVGLDSALFDKIKKRDRKAFCVGDDIVVFYQYVGN